MKGKGIQGTFRLLAAAISLTALLGCSSQGSQVPEKLILGAAVGDWAELPKRITKILLEDELGYSVMVRDVAADTAFSALAEEDIDIFTDVWHPNHKSYTDEFVPRQVKIAGDLADPTSGVYTNADQGWLVPKWTRNNYQVDSLDDIAILEPGDSLYDALDQDNDGLIELIGGEVGWAVVEINDEKIEYYNEKFDLDMRQLVVTHAGGHKEMLAAIKSKLNSHEDVLFYLWTPHHLFTEYADALSDEEGQILWLRDPWGFWEEPEGTDYYTCFPSATIYFAYRAGLENDHPDTVTLLERIRMTIADLNEYCYWESITKDGKATVKEKDDYARQWIEDHQVEVNSWLAGPLD